jgi:hypothetical protein
MFRDIWAGAAFVSCALLLNAQPAHAQQTINFLIGQFRPLGASSRTAGDVLVADQEFLTPRDAPDLRPIPISDFNSLSIGGEWLIPIGTFIEAGAGLSFTHHTVPTVYTNFVNANGAEVFQDLQLRTLPIDLTFRLLPLGQHNGFQPYFGGGLGIVSWRYSETGQFVDTTDNSIFNGNFVGSGTATGPVAMGGIRFSGSKATAGFEIKYRKASGNLSTTDFLAPKIDLGGWTYQFNVGMRFGH